MRSTKGFLAPGIGLLGVAMFAAPAMASDATGGFALHGVGAQTCQLMLQELQPAVRAAAVTPAVSEAATPAAAAPAVAAPALAATAAAAPSGAAPAAATPSAVVPAPTASAAVQPATAPVAPTLPAGTPAGSPAGRPATSASAAAASPATNASGGRAGANPASPVTPAASLDAAPAALGMRPILTSWIMGYLTASDRLVKNTFDETPVMAPEALTAMIVGVCQRNPDARVESVANNVLNQLAAARVLHDSPVVEAREGDRAVLIRKATLAAMQTTLVRDNLLKAPADGVFGKSTAAALQAFQKSQRLPETGLPDPATVVRLLIEMPAKVAAKPARTVR